MAQTTHGVPYPLPDEPVAEGAARIRDVAEALEAKVLNGRIDWGPAGAPDTSLVRAGVGILGTPGALVVADGGPKRVELGVDRLGGGQAAVTFGAAADTNLYRLQAGWLKTDGGLWTSGEHVVAGPQLSLVGEGRIVFGSGADTNLYRIAASHLHTDGVFSVGGGVLIYGDTLLDAGDAGRRLYFGSGYDTSLYRAAAGRLKTDGTLEAGAAVLASSGLTFGGDTSIARSAANQLRTPGQLVTGADVFVADGTSQRVAIGNRYLGWPAIEFGNQAGIVYIANGALTYRGSNGTVTTLAPP